jgi:HrpA-like RNA helicase
MHSGSLTDIGVALCAVPVEPRVALLLLNGSFLGCLGPLLTYAAAIESKSIFSSDFEPSSASVKAIIGRVPFSDFDAVVIIRNKYVSMIQKQSKAAAKKYLDSVHVSSHALELLEQQRLHLLQAMSGSGLECCDSLDDLNAVARACIVAAFWPNIGIVSDASGNITRCTCTQGAAGIQQSCVLVGTNLPNGAIFTYVDAAASANGKVACLNL